MTGSVKVLIIGYGNPLRSDDAIGLRAAEQLAGLQLSNHIKVRHCFQLTPELAAEVSDVATVIFVDAARSGNPGSISSEEIRPKHELSIFTHDFSPSSILDLAQELYGRRPTKAFCVSMMGECFDHGENLSAKVAENMPRLIHRVRELVEQSA